MAARRGVAVDNRVHDYDFDDCDALLEGRMGDGWQLFFESADVQIRRRVTEGSSLTEFRLDGIIPFPCKVFFEMLTCLEYRRVYDKFTTEIRRLPGAFADPESECIYWRLKLPLLAERDYVFLRRISFENATQTYRLVSLAAAYGAAVKVKPTCDGVVRVEQYVSKAVMRPRGPDACEYHLLASQDLKGNVPGMVVDFFASKGLATMVGGHRKACANFLAWKAAYRGEIRPTRVGRFRAADEEEAVVVAAVAEALEDRNTTDSVDPFRSNPPSEGGGVSPSPAPPGMLALAASESAGLALLKSNAAAERARASVLGRMRAKVDANPELGQLRAALAAAVSGDAHPGQATAQLIRKVRDGVKEGVKSVDEKIAAALLLGGGGGLGSTPEGANTVTQDYLALTCNEPMRLVEAPKKRANHNAASGTSQQLQTPGALSLSDASQPGGGAERAASVVSSLDQMRIGATYTTPRGNLVKRTGLTRAVVFALFI